MGQHRWFEPQRARVRGSHLSMSSNMGGCFLWDTFTGINGTALESHPMNIGPGWVDDSNAWELLDGEAYTEDFGSTLVSDSGETDGRLTVTPSSGWCQPIFRYVDANNYWYCKHYLFSGPSTFAMEIHSVISGVDTTEAFSSSGVPAEFETLIVDLDGDNMHFRILSKNLDFNDSTFNTATKHGFRSFNNGSGDPTACDNFSFCPVPP